MLEAISRRSFLFSLQSTFSTDVKVVTLYASVRDRDGKIIKNLAKDDFTLEEDARPQIIKYFSQESNLPLTLGLVVDTSGSQRRVLGEERTASYRFLSQVLREDKDLAFVIRFDREVELLQDLTSSRKKLEEALGLLTVDQPQRRPPFRRNQFPPRGRRGGGTSLYDAVLLASDELMRKQAGRKALILLTDGVDTGSKVSLNDAIESAQRADTLVYSILFADSSAYGPVYARRRKGGKAVPVQTNGKKILQKLATETGGGFFEISLRHPLPKTYEQIEEELRNQYSLGYTSDNPNPTPTYRKLHLAAKQKALKVQSRGGYYADR